MHVRKCMLLYTYFLHVGPRSPNPSSGLFFVLSSSLSPTLPTCLYSTVRISQVPTSPSASKRSAIHWKSVNSLACNGPCKACRTPWSFRRSEGPAAPVVHLWLSPAQHLASFLRRWYPTSCGESPNPYLRPISQTIGTIILPGMESASPLNRT